MNTAALNLAWADALIAGLAAAGLRHLALAPGARSAPLTLAALRRPELTCHVINDERAAGYFALGIARATGIPAAVLCTSGTATANLLPAVMEANLAAVPLLVLTADRPAEAIGWGANQAADQTRLYGDQLRGCHAVPTPTTAVDAGYLRVLAARLIEECVSPLPGPVHANLPFREPLLPDRIPAPPDLPEPIAVSHATAVPDEGAVARLATRISGRPGVIVCGEARYPAGFAAAVTRLAAALEAPILAEPLACLRHGPHDKSRILAHQARFLRTGDLPTPDWVLRCGAFPVSRTIERWLAGLKDAHHALIAAPGRWPDPLRQGAALLRGDPLAVVTALIQDCRPASAEFCAAWQEAENAASRRVTEICTAGPLFEGTVVRILLDALPPGTQLFVGNSLAIRAVDAFGGTRDQPLTLFGNRGASGIDGNLATAAGIAAGTLAPTVLLVGDQALLHDCGSLALLAGRKSVIVVLDNGGGGIFDHLPFARTLPPELLARGWTAPPRVDLLALATAFGWHVSEVADLPGLETTLATAFAQDGAALIRVVIDRAASRAGFLA